MTAPPDLTAAPAEDGGPAPTPTDQRAAVNPAGLESPARWRTTLGRLLVTLALICAAATLLIFADYTPIRPTNAVVLSLFAINAVFILMLIALLLGEAWRLMAAWRAQAAGARLHIRIVGLFSLIAAIPAVVIALVGSLTLERTLNPGLLQDVKGFVYTTGEAARLFGESQCRALLRETELTAADLDRVEPLYTSNRALFREFFASRARFLSFSSAALIKPDGEVVDRATGPDSRVVTPEPNDFEEARKAVATCLILDGGKTFVALRKLSAFNDMFVYAERGVDPFAVEFPQQAQGLIELYNAFDAHRRTILLAFGAMYALIALVMLLSAVWMGLSFANRLVLPIRRLIAATDQVSTGNLYVQVPVNRREGDLARLGETFNNMTSELRLQQNRLLAASRTIDERRLFTEAVLSGVPAGVIGVDAAGAVSVLNPFAQSLVEDMTGHPAPEAIGKPVDTVVPELAPIIREAEAARVRVQQGQIALMRRGRERIFNVRITGEPSQGERRNRVITLDDITDLVSAQRTSAWADVARRIAHEIKNPLTPIQLSAERLKRKYGKVIVQDRDVFDQCTDTIVRQVDDIKRMVDEFSSFARMPKARLEDDDLNETIRQVLFLMRVGHPTITFEDHLPATPTKAQIDRRLLSQALTNIIKNATEGLAALEHPPAQPRVEVTLSEGEDDTLRIDVIDNGKGFPAEGRQRLLEPYMTTRAEGTGLGLPIVAKILEDHGGGIELLDAPSGQGAWVRLWMRRRHAAEPANAAADRSQQAQQQPTSQQATRQAGGTRHGD